MQKKKSDVYGKSWNILRLALLWARKCGVLNLKRRLIAMTMDLHIPTTTNFLPCHTCFCSTTTEERGTLHYGERQFSFDDSPIVHVSMHRPPSFRFLFRFLFPCIHSQLHSDSDSDSDSDEEGIDVKAEEFIANFYHQIKLQRQISYLRRHNDMIQT